eukprot:GHVQ01004497.1.p2 GENE.GHVQ01004497.1~~GHVQ01004497.1.p2  ORF type:complete len:321 (-),score=34.55 GHVQ01004497.1:2550-3512(-)
MAQSTSEWPTTNRFMKKKKRDLDVQEIKKSLHGQKVTRNDLFGKRKKVDRGWGAPDAVGWGVLGHHGSLEKDIGAQVAATSRDAAHKPKPSTLVRNENGLWVKVKASQSLGSLNPSQSQNNEAGSRSCRNDASSCTLIDPVSPSSSRYPHKSRRVSSDSGERLGDRHDRSRRRDRKSSEASVECLSRSRRRKSISRGRESSGETSGVRQESRNSHSNLECDRRSNGSEHRPQRCCTREHRSPSEDSSPRTVSRHRTSRSPRECRRATHRLGRRSWSRSGSRERRRSRSTSRSRGRSRREERATGTISTWQRRGSSSYRHK